MMKAGRSYLISREELEAIINQGTELFVVEVVSEKQIGVSSSYIKEAISLSDLPTAKWLENYSKKETIYLVGNNDKELVLGIVTLRMLGYDAIAAVWK